MMQSGIENIIRPIVEGQLRGFVKEHPSILDGVIWFKNGADRENSFVNSIAKRLINDLTSDLTISRLRAALVGKPSADVAKTEEVAHHSASLGDGSGFGPGAVPTSEGWYFARNKLYGEKSKIFPVHVITSHKHGGLIVEMYGSIIGFEWFGPVVVPKG